MAKSVLKDQNAREAIRTALDVNMMVLAGAGAGKTHELIQRMVSLVKNGTAEADRIAAITFTRKAAGEMRGRFYTELQNTLDNSLDIVEKDNIQRALDKIHQCFIGTIHSFCARLLRERPIELGLPPDFKEVGDRDEVLFRRKAWDRFIQDRYDADDARLQRIIELGVRLEDLYNFYQLRYSFSDVRLHIIKNPLPDLDPAVEKTQKFIVDIEQNLPSQFRFGYDKMMRSFFQAKYFYKNHQIENDSDKAKFLQFFESADVTQNKWAGQKPYAQLLNSQKLPDFKKNVVDPSLAEWRRFIYPELADFIEDAIAYFERYRIDTATLTFNDLLIKSSELLRDNPQVRRHLQKYFSHILVDEFQDTDPIQAEVLFYLTGIEVEEKDWQKLTPKPGSLFLVGDEKQSIYRFRRADIDIFRFVRDKIAETNGSIVELNTSFRSYGNLCDWINRSFPAVFSESDSRYQADYTSLIPNRPAGRDHFCVRKITTSKIKGNSVYPIVLNDARRIGEFIATAIGGNTDLNGDGDDAILTRIASPGDFMILIRYKKYLHLYAKALEQLDIPYDISGSSTFSQSIELRAVVQMLEVVYNPDDPIALLAYLRGPFVGVGDDEFYDFMQTDGVFHYLKAVPDTVKEPVRGKITEAFGHLKETNRLFRTLPPGPALELLFDRMGLLGFAATRPMGSSRAGNLKKMLAIFRELETKGMDWAVILSELRLLVEQSLEEEELTLESGQRNVVRLMNLHKAKGLQAKVVFLADPYRSQKRPSPDFHVSRTGGDPFIVMPIRNNTYASDHSIAEPNDWDDYKVEEEKYLDAEDNRLLYVAATRARNMLVVSYYEGNPEKGPWTRLKDALQGVPELSFEFKPSVSEKKEDIVDYEAYKKDRTKRYISIAEPTYKVTSVTGEMEDFEFDQMPGERRGYGKDYGTAVHRAMEGFVKGEIRDMDSYLNEIFRQEKVGPELKEKTVNLIEAFRHSTLWNEIKTAYPIYAEVPFGTPIGSPIVNHTGSGDVNEVVRGVIDLVARLTEGWIIIDYKTDQVADEADLEKLGKRYEPQIKAYRDHWQTITGEPVIRAGLWSTDLARFVELKFD